MGVIENVGVIGKFTILCIGSVHLVGLLMETGIGVGEWVGEGKSPDVLETCKVVGGGLGFLLAGLLINAAALNGIRALTNRSAGN